jgi:hypothetical protein
VSTETEAQIFFRNHVLPSIQDWQVDETAIHKAMMVATNLSHMADYFWKSYSGDSNKVLGKKSLKEFREQLEVNNPDYALIRDVCDAHKHLELGRKPKRVTKADQTNVGKMGWGEAKWGNARWGSPEEVVVTDDSGEKHHFIGLVRRTETMWESLLI